MSLGDALLFRYDGVDHPTLAILMNLAQDVTPANIRRAIDALLAAKRPLDSLIEALGEHYRDELVATAFPGVSFPHVSVRTHRPRKYVKNWHGDLFVTFTDDGGVSVLVASGLGVGALAAMTRDQRTVIVDLSLTRELSPRATETIVGLTFDGVRALSASDTPAEHLATLVLHCPSLATFSYGALTPDLADALATTSLSYAGVTADDDCLARLAGCRLLSELYLSRDDKVPFTSAGIECLARLPLRRLSLYKVEDQELPAIARIGTLERLDLTYCPITDVTPLVALHELRALNLHDTQVDDAGMRALATLPNLADLDICDTPVTADGIRALAAAPALKRLGIAWDCSAEVAAAAAALGVQVVESDQFGGGGALWGYGYSG